MIGRKSSVRRRIGAGATLLMMFAAVLTTLAAPSGADHEAGHVAVTQLAGSELNKCQGALPTPGSENTDKRLVGGTLVPGGTAVFEFTYPFDPTDTTGRQDFVILDCVFVNDEPVLAFELHGVPNTVSPFIFQFTVDIPTDVVVGSEFCNVGKTTAAPSSAQASNRKAGPACFVVGGDLRVVKVDQAGAPLTGATFSVVCTPTSTLLPVIIEGQTGNTYTGTTGTDNAIAIAGPLGTSCVITETVAPPGYVLATPASVTAVIGVDGPDITFVNPPALGSLAITKVSDTPGTFTFTVDCPGTSVTNQSVTVTVATAGAPGTTSAPIAGIPVGTVCTVAETTAPGFNPQPPQNVTIALGTNTVTFTNVRQTGSLVITKVSDTPGSFTFSVNCPGTSVTNQSVTVDVTAAGAPGTTSAPIAGIPTGTVCTVTEQPAPGFEPQAPQNVTIALGTNTVTFTNVRQTGSLVITKVSDTPGSFTFTVNCPGTSVTNQSVTVDVTAAGAPGTTSAPVAGIPTGTVCTVTESPAAGFAPQAPQTVTIVQGTNTVTFTNVRLTGDLVVAKTTVDGTGTFNFTVDCNPGTVFDQTFQLTNNETRRIAGIPTGTTCSVVEAANALFTSAVTPGNGTVVIAAGDNLVSFTNTARPPVLAVTKTADAGSVVAGGTVGYTVTVTNTGAGRAVSVTLDDPLPTLAGVNWAISPAFAGPGTCTVNGSAPAQTLTCSFGNMDPGASATVRLSSGTTAATAGSLVNTATARAANFGPVTATATIVVTVPTAVLGAAQTAPEATVPAPTTTTTAAPAPTTTTTVAPRVLSQSLPRTGVDALTMVGLGLGLVLVGAALKRGGRSRRSDG